MEVEVTQLWRLHELWILLQGYHTVGWDGETSPSYPIESHHQKPSKNIGFVWNLRCSSGCIQAHWLDIFQVGSMNAAWHCLQSKSEFSHPLQWFEHVWTHLARTIRFVLRKHPTFCRVNRGNPPKIMLCFHHFPIQRLHQNFRSPRWRAVASRCSTQAVPRLEWRWRKPLSPGSNVGAPLGWAVFMGSQDLFFFFCFFWSEGDWIFVGLFLSYPFIANLVFSFLGTLDNLGDHILCSMVCCISMQLFGHPMLIPSGYD